MPAIDACAYGCSCIAISPCQGTYYCSTNYQVMVVPAMNASMLTVSPEPLAEVFNGRVGKHV